MKMMIVGKKILIGYIQLQLFCTLFGFENTQAILGI